MAPNIASIEAIFSEALEIPSAEARAAYLDRACAADPELRRQVESLIDAHDRAGRFLASPTVSFESGSPEPVGSNVGPYKLREQIGEGGMGVVYVAEQTQPVRRKVALKIIKPGMDTKQLIARFEAERQALAMMDHPNIARVFDGGTTPSGYPYFVMELVRGIPITEYCDEQKLTIRERLELFVLVCRAVQHAHQKGVIHRDLKPSNILITLHDGVPVPKVIDFGVAKATGQALTDKTVYTAFTQLVGTPLYMSPEQVELSGLDIDTRSDIYSLGVLLYELLTGTTPFDAETLHKAAFDEMRRIIREQEPQSPSTRLSSLGGTLTTVSARRSADPQRLGPSLRGELDWIVMKALEKDRRRRYETANDFGSDVMRYLTDQPVQACPPSAGYRLRKFVRRNKGPVAASLTLAALLVLGALGTSIGLVWALQAERKATQEKDRATAAEANAKEEAAVAAAVRDFLTDDLLAGAAPDRNARNRKVTVEEVLGRAASRIEGKFALQPRIEAEVRLTIGETYRALGDFTAAQPHLQRSWEIGRRVLGEEHRRTLTFMGSLALLYLNQGKFAQAEPLMIRGLEDSRRVLGEEHRDTLAAMNNLATVYLEQRKFTLAQPLYAKALEVGRRALGEEHRDTLASMNNLAQLYVAQRKFAQAEPLLVETLELARRVQGEEHPNTITLMNNLAWCYGYQRHYAQAEPLLVRALELRRRVQGEEHRDTLRAMLELAKLYAEQEKFALAEPLVVRALAVSRRVLGEEDPNTVGIMTVLTRMYHNEGQAARHEPLYVQTLELCRHVRGDEHPDTVFALGALAELYMTQRAYSKAEPLYVRTLEISRRIHEEAHVNTLIAANNLASLYWCNMEFDRSIPLLEDVLNLTRDKSGPGHPDTLNAMDKLGINYRDAGRLPDAIDILQEVRAAALKQPGFPVGDLASLSTDLGETYRRAGQLAKAETLCRETLETVRQRHKEASSQSTDLQATLALILLDQQRYPEAEPLLRECLKFREQNEMDLWRTFSTKSLLGGSLLGRKKYAEAEPLLLAGYEGMKQREGKMEPIYRPRLTKAIEQLVQLYEATGNTDQAEAWHTKLPVTKSAKPVETKNHGSPSQEPAR